MMSLFGGFLRIVANKAIGEMLLKYYEQKKEA